MQAPRHPRAVKRRPPSSGEPAEPAPAEAPRDDRKALVLVAFRGNVSLMRSLQLARPSSSLRARAVSGVWTTLLSALPLLVAPQDNARAAAVPPPEAIHDEPLRAELTAGNVLLTNVDAAVQFVTHLGKGAAARGALADAQQHLGAGAAGSGLRPGSCACTLWMCWASGMSYS